MSYREWPTLVAGAVLWRSDGRAEPDATTTILPDGCLDLILVDDRLLVAGPDSRARVHHGAGAVLGLRLALGRGPRLLGVPADVLTDRTVDLADVWSSCAARVLLDRVCTDPARALTTWAASAGDPEAARVFAAADAGLGVTEIAARSGLGARTLHRRCRAWFGYGPQHLVRVLRLQRALAAARRGAGWADVAAATGYADQPHLAREFGALTGHRPGELLGRRPSGQASGA